MKSNPTSCTALNVGQVQELINQFPKSEEIMQTQFIINDAGQNVAQEPTL